MAEGLSENPFAELARTLATASIGRPLEYLPQVGSTNDLVRARARAGQPEGLVLITDEQTAGRGRQGRGWAAPPGTSLLCSTLLRPTWLAPEQSFAITMLAGVALCEAVEAVTPTLAAALKWPNDLMLAPDGAAPRKAAGILSELALEGQRIGFVVLGIGVNVNWAPSGTVDGRDLAALATSVGAAAGREIDRVALLGALVERLDARYAALRRGAQEALFGAWQGRLATLGQHVTVRTPAGTLSGTAEGVEPSGALRLRDASGALHIITAGDVGG